MFEKNQVFGNKKHKSLQLIKIAIKASKKTKKINYAKTFAQDSLGEGGEKLIYLS